METNLLEKTVNELMEKFGAGNHKPGSGSAAAFQGMVSAKLISTVISLTLDVKRRDLYYNHINVLLDFHKDIEERIYPQLTELFKSDSIQFDKTIKSRIARDKEKDEITKNQLRRQALADLKVSIEIPFQIATLCKELAIMSAYVFDNGFKSARGDSQVGLSGAVSAFAGCLAIIRLNVLSFNSDEYEYTKSVVSQVDNLYNDYKELILLADSKIEILREEFEIKIPLFEGINTLIQKARASKGAEVENCVRELQTLIWNNKHLLWKKNIPTNPLEILRPDYILKSALGYDFISSSTYGVLINEDKSIKVAGIIDQPNKIVAVSNGFPKEVQNFTAAHELGHAILHEQSILHRDIPVDTSGKRNSRDRVEIQADAFATYFLMPTKLVKKEFEKRYSTKAFKINEEIAFKFGGRSITDLKKECKNIRSLSRKLASTELYDSNNFISLAKQFNVSIEAMAIRLEELNLVQY
ncbi:cyclodeaminase/cyclohydrolase family protein [Flavobacterium sediminilitoris]|uniref:Cyclodeaminase/cyclohydrolase family protein n=1 Tax=Flavobacterium sediminilitoris TaxID=2024526 RepID=A0ABY4HN93_9FLAO|nr:MULTISPECIES: cyclodeaminase/cyclohydrolase family protein [Flavobacterium]UOX33712.1 cyclodeaminase/cyclohydrolase family protein [Flavobacterium sediminilitoris]